MPVSTSPARVEATASRSFPPALLLQGALALIAFILAAMLPQFHFFSEARHYLPLHSILEFLSIGAALMVFAIGWFSFSHVREARFQILGCAFLAMALLDFFHTFSYAGMPDMIGPSSPEKAINFWLPARTIGALALLAAAVLPARLSLTRRGRSALLGATLALVGGLVVLGLFFPQTAPPTFVPGQGLTSFKIGVEYLVIAIYTTSMVLLLRQWRQIGDGFHALLATALWLMILGELSFTLYRSVTDLHNLLGHLCKAWSDGLILWAIFTKAVEEPHRRLRTAEHRSEHLLIHSERQTRALQRENQVLMDNVFLAILFVRDGRFVRANRHAETLFGYAPAALEGLSTAALFPDAAGYEAWQERAGPVIDRGEIFTSEEPLTPREGDPFWCLIRVQALALEEPLEGCIWIVEDVTERRRARQAREEAADLYRAIFDSRGVVKVLIDPDDGSIVDANQAAALFYGETRERLRGRRIWELGAQPAEEVIQLLADLKSGRAELRTEYLSQHCRAGGQPCDVGIHMDLIHRDRRSLLLATILDVTARNAAEAALKHSERHFRTLFTATRVAMLLIDPDKAEIVDANGAAGDYYGYGVDQLRGMGLQVIAPMPPERLAADLRLIVEGQLAHVQSKHRLADGELRDVDVYAGALELEGRLLLYAFVHDITEQKTAEHALLAANHHKDEFLAMLGHELRNPLAPIRSAAEVLRVNPTPEQARWAAGLLGRQVDHLTRLVDDLLDVARINRGKLRLQTQDLDLREPAQRAVEQTGPIFQSRDQRLLLVLPPEAVWVRGDAERLTQVVVNLLTNAAKFSAPRQEVTLLLEGLGDQARLQVRDQGSGIAPALLPDIFNPFRQGEQTLERSSGGLGLGLALVHGIVELHGGQIQAQSGGADQGSTFVLNLPLIETAGQGRSEPAPNATATGRTILVVDDNPDAAESCAMLLRCLGQHVEVAPDGSAALEAAPRLEPDLILLDIGLPEMDGYEVARRLRRTEPGRRARLVALTGYGQDDDRQRAMSAGFDAHLLKPVNLAALTAELEQAGLSAQMAPTA